MEKVAQQNMYPLEQQRTPVSRCFVVAQFVLRILIVAFTAVAITTMATSGSSILVFGAKFGAQYYDSAAFKFLMGVDITVCALALLSLMALYFVQRKPSNFNHFYYLFLHDLILMVLMISGCAAASAIGYVAMYGQRQTLWFQICDRFGNFCLRNGISVGFSYAAFLCLFALTIITSFKLNKA